MKVSFWECKYQKCDTWIDNDGEHFIFDCLHPKNIDGCLLRNKWNNDVADCKLLDKEIKDE